MRHMFIASLVTLGTVALIGCAGTAAHSDSAQETDETSAALSSLNDLRTERTPPEDPVVLEMERAPERFFSRILSVTDDSGQSRARLRIVANDPDALELFAASEFRLRVGDGMSRSFASEPTASREEPDDSDETEDRIKILVIEDKIDLAPGVRGFALNIVPRSELKLPWKNYYHYTYRDCVEVTRLKALRRVYVSIWSKNTASSSWSTMLSNDKLAWKETVNRCDHDSYQIRTKVRTKKSNAYSYGSWD